MAAQWPVLEPLLAADVKTRAAERVAALGRDLKILAETGERNTRAVFAQLRRSLETALEGPGPVQLTFGDLDKEERDQLDRDRAAWEARLAGLDAELDRELAAIRRRFAGARELVFPFAIAVCVPDAATGDEREVA